MRPRSAPSENVHARRIRDGAPRPLPRAGGSPVRKSPIQRAPQPPKEERPQLECTPNELRVSLRPSEPHH